MKVAANDDLDVIFGKPKTDAEDPDTSDYETESEESAVDTLAKASDLLKKSATLFEYLSYPDFCKTLTKRDRGIMDKQASLIHELTDEIDQLVIAEEL